MALGLSNSSSTSSTKTVNGKPDLHESLSPCRNLPFIPATDDGYPCCWLYDDDLKGMGISAGGLPAALLGFSLNGWRLDFDATGKVKMTPMPGARWEQGCRGYLKACYELVADDLWAWLAYCREWR